MLVEKLLNDSKMPTWWNGRHSELKIRRVIRVGSNPTVGTIKFLIILNIDLIMFKDLNIIEKFKPIYNNIKVKDANWKLKSRN